jgi:hypothetical protein
LKDGIGRKVLLKKLAKEKKMRIKFDRKNLRRMQFNEKNNMDQILKIKKITRGEIENICKNQVNPDKHSKHG